MIRDLEYEPKKEKVPKASGDDLQRGFIRDDKDFYAPCDSERKDEFGSTVTHQDSKTFPGPRGLNTY